MDTSEEKICPICEYYIRDGVGCECENIAREKKRSEARRRQEESEALGGLRAVEMFTLERLTVTDHNARAIMLAKEFDRNKHNLYLYGPTGTGKTHIASVAARKFIGKTSVRTVKLVDLARTIRSCRSAVEESDVMTCYIQSGVLIIDDVGVEKGTEFNVGLLYELIDKRYLNKPGGLIVTTNLSLDELAQRLGEDRTTSRLAQMCKGRICNLTGEEDHRLDNPTSKAV